MRNDVERASIFADIILNFWHENSNWQYTKRESILRQSFAVHTFSKELFGQTCKYANLRGGARVCKQKVRIYYRVCGRETTLIQIQIFVQKMSLNQNQFKLEK